MRNPIRMTLLCGAATLLPVWYAEAQTPGQCAIAPTCSELGYEQKASDCNGQHMLKCPFDKDKVFCGGINCSYTNTSLPSGCSNAPSCTKDGKTYFSTICSSCYTGYKLNSDGTCSQTCTYSSSNTGCATYNSCQRGSSNGIYTYYKCTSCVDGYELSGSYCYDCANRSLNTKGRTSGPYTQEECDKACDLDEPFEYECGNQIWYGCKPKYDDYLCA